MSFSAGCGEEFVAPPGDAAVAAPPDVAVDAPAPWYDMDNSGLPDGYRLWPCSEAGQACDPHDPCAINPVCGPDLRCRPTYLMDCDDKLECTTDTCAGTGVCKNVPKSGWCLLGVKQTNVPDGGVGKTEFKCFQAGQRNPADNCQVCNPTEYDGGAANNTKWTSVNSGSCDDNNPCTKDDNCQRGYCQGTDYSSQCSDGLTCTDDFCDGTGGCKASTLKKDWCLINNVCYKAGAPHPGGSCSSCNPKTSQSAWTAAISTCTIGGKCYAKGAKHAQGCAECDPAMSIGSWSVKGTTHCLISDKCVTSGTKDPTTGSCSSCQPTQDAYSYYPDPGYCRIAGQCIKDGTKHPMGCATCKSSVSTTAWTPNSSSVCLLNDQCLTRCGSACVDLKSSPSNCGGCGSACTSGQYCNDGKCGTNPPSCAAIKAANPSATSGAYTLYSGSTQFRTYCDMTTDGGGWTLVARFCNYDGTQWIDSASYWYDRTSEVGNPSSRNENRDALSRAFWLVKGNEFKISRTDNGNDAHLLMTNSNCLGSRTFRDKIKSLGTFRTGAWSSNAVRGTCTVRLGNNYSSTSAFNYANCSSSIGAPRSVSFFADWSSGNGAVMMIGGGGSSCNSADHGIAITEANAACFGTSYQRSDFGYRSGYGYRYYSLNLFVK